MAGEPGSEAAFQDSEIEEVVLLVAAKPVGTVGVVVSAGGGLLTVTVMTAEVVVLPAASRAIADKVWVPLPRVVVFQL